MATRNEAAQKLADTILELVIEKDIIDISLVEANRRIVNTATGGTSMTEGASIENIVLYQKDYRQSGFDPEFYEKIDAVVDNCLCAQHVGNDCIDYNLPIIENLGWNDGRDEDTVPHEAYEYDAWIAFGTGVQDGEVGGQMCLDITEPSPLRLTDNVLEILSQFVPFEKIKTKIDPVLAEQVLDTNIYELIPGETTRQQRIDKLFSEFIDLLGPSPLNAGSGFEVDVDDDGVMDTWTNLLTGQDYWNILYGIKPDDNPNTGNIVRLERHTQRSGQSLETMRGVIDDYLRDLDYTASGELDDERPDSITSGKGYLQIRHLNQAIIIRNEEDKDIGLIGADEYNPDWLQKGFTISMWVRFLTKSSGGTLFNFGNPTRNNQPYGFKLETFTVSKYDYLSGNMLQTVDLPPGSFVDSDYSRFIRLVVYDHIGLRDSHFGTFEFPRIQTTIEGLAYEYNPKMAFNYTEIPINFTEWFYIVATFDPRVKEDDSFDTESDDGQINMNYYKDFWQNHSTFAPTGEVEYCAKTDEGARCKVEIISKTDMNRAIGFKK